MKPNIPLAVRHLIAEYRRFLRTSYCFLDPRLREQFEAHLAQADVVVRGPYDDFRARVMESNLARQLPEWDFGVIELTSHMLIRAFLLADETAVVALWERCGLTRPWNDPHLDIRRKLQVRPDLFLVGLLDGDVVASVMAGYEGHRGWINYLAVAPEHQGKGFGRAMMAEAERLLAEAGCPKVNLQVRSSNQAVIEFYRRLGYSVDDVVSMGKRLAQASTSGGGS